jgi:TM2 domain-containing membrane protein YozV
MSKPWANLYKMIMVALVVMAIFSLIEAIIRETPCCPKGGQGAFAIGVLILAWIGWPHDTTEQ